MRTAILISGRGSTMQALLDLASTFRCSLIVSSKASAAGLFRARRMGIPTHILEKKIDFDLLSAELEKRGIQRIFLAGFMKIIPESFFQKWRGRMINIHPSLLPLHPGLAAFEASHEHKTAMGASLHVVTEELDGGPLLRQACFHSLEKWQSFVPSMAEAQILLSFTEQRLVREVSKLWK